MKHSISYMLATLTVAASFAASAQDAATRAGVISESECSVVASSGGIAGEAVGSTVGAVGGAVLGELLFGGRTAQNLGAIVGGGVGSVAGEELTKKNTYRCLVKVNVNDGSSLYVETVGQRLRNVGEGIVLVRGQNGVWIAR